MSGSTGRAAQKGGQRPLSVQFSFLCFLSPTINHGLETSDRKFQKWIIHKFSVACHSKWQDEVSHHNILFHLGHDLPPWPVYSVGIQPAHGSVGSLGKLPDKMSETQHAQIAFALLNSSLKVWDQWRDNSDAPKRSHWSASLGGKVKTHGLCMSRKNCSVQVLPVARSISGCSWSTVQKGESHLGQSRSAELSEQSNS